METWRPVYQFEGIYEVSDLGRVRRVKAACRTHVGKILKPAPTPGKPYLRYCLRRDGKNHHRMAHRVVLEAFVGPRPPGTQSRHWNGKPRDNRLTNLLWGTPTENAADKARHGTARTATILTEKQVRAIRASAKSYNALAKRFGISRYTVRDVKKGWSWKRLL